jgi:hypothetical protein
MSAPTRFKYGVTNSAVNAPVGMMGQPDASEFHTYWNDFDTYTAADWTVTNVGVTPTQALTPGDGGLLLLTTTAGATDSTYLQKVASSFALVAGKQAWFKARFLMSDVTLAGFVMGLQVTDSTPAAVSDGVFFSKASGAATYDVASYSGSVGTTASAVGTLVNATSVELAWYYDGKTEIQHFKDGVLTGRLTPAALPTGNLTVSFGMVNGAAAIKTMTVDYIYAVKER